MIETFLGEKMNTVQRWLVGMLLAAGVLGMPSHQVYAQPVSAGDGFSCAALPGETVKCWGDNLYGSLGNGTNTSTNSPVTVSGLSGNIVAISSSAQTCALVQSGAVYCWGKNQNGAVGDGTTKARNTAAAVIGLSGKVLALTAGNAHTCALIQGGSVQCWGSNSDGQLGDGSFLDSTKPVTVSGLSGSVAAISAGSLHTCVLLQGGSVQCWGTNFFRQLDSATLKNSSTPVNITLAGPVVALSSGGSHTCVLRQSGAVQCWGYNNYGQLGNGVTAFSSAPVTVSGLSGTVTGLVAGLDHTCVLLSSGGLQCWGYNLNGALGDGTTTNSSVPVAVQGLSGSVSAVAGGYRHTCAAIGSSSVQCWGDGFYGQLGNGTNKGVTTPVSVSGIASLSTNRGFSFLGVASGGSAALNLTAHVVVAGADIGKSGQLFVAAALPTGQIYVLTASGWAQFTGTLTPYASAALGSHSIPILNGSVDVSSLAGTQMVAGYGTDATDMLNNQKFSYVYKIP